MILEIIKIPERDERKEGKFYLPYNLKWMETTDLVNRYNYFNNSIKEWSKDHNIVLKICIDKQLQIEFDSMDDLLLFKLAWL